MNMKTLMKVVFAFVIMTLFAMLNASVISNDATMSSVDPLEELEKLIEQGNCSKLSELSRKLASSFGQPPLPLKLIQDKDLVLVSKKVGKRMQERDCRRLRKRSAEKCEAGSIGDGWCDIQCNTKDHQWDGGDCCPHTCKLKERPFPCGSGGYQCIGARKIPVWFAARTRLCYKWWPDGNGGQCGGGASRELCAKVNQLTPVYRDDTDNRPGGCRMQWGIETSATVFPEWFKNVKICFRWHPDGDGGQCGGGAPREICAPVNSYTAVYRDDTDNRGGGCQMSWRLTIPENAEYWMEDVALCYEWYPDGDGGQCGGGAERKLCAVAGMWTSYYRDDTDKRPGGCRMRWGLVL